MLAFFVIADNMVGVGNEIAVAREIGYALFVVIGAIAIAVVAATEIMGEGAVLADIRPSVNVAFLPFEFAFLDNTVLDIVGLTELRIRRNNVLAFETRAGHAPARRVDWVVRRDVGTHNFVHRFATGKRQHGGGQQQNGFQSGFW